MNTGSISSFGSRINLCRGEASSTHSAHGLLMGTHTSPTEERDNEQNYLMIAQVHLPIDDPDGSGIVPLYPHFTHHFLQQRHYKALLQKLKLNKKSIIQEKLTELD